MRLILSLKALKSSYQNDVYYKYNTSMHGFLFKQLEKTKSYKGLHDKKEFKPFCFGNLFPITNNKIVENSLYKVVVSSPVPKLIEELFFSISQLEQINLGETLFEVESIEVKRVNLGTNSIIENISPINLTKDVDGKIKSLKFHDESYLEFLRKNLIHKYNYFVNGDRVDENFDLFSNVLITEYPKRKEASFRIFFYNKEKNDFFDVIGSKLVFKFNHISDKQLRIFQFCFDTGFGERTSYGAGFMVERWKK